MADEVLSTLRRALRKLTSQKSQIDRRISAIETALGALDGRGPANGTRSRKRLSAATRKAIGKRMKAYWTKRRAGAKGKAKGGRKG